MIQILPKHGTLLENKRLEEIGANVATTLTINDQIFFKKTVIKAPLLFIQENLHMFD